MIGSFVEDYQQKYKNRQVKLLALFGTVEMCLEKRHNFIVSTG
jgi:hypothetical protein